MDFLEASYAEIMEQYEQHLLFNCVIDEEGKTKAEKDNEKEYITPSSVVCSNPFM